MEPVDVLAILAAAFGVGMGAAPLLQARRAYRRRSSEDVSLAFLAVLFCGGVMWFSYGIALGNAALVVANAVGLAGSGTAILVALRYRDAVAVVTSAPAGTADHA